MFCSVAIYFIDLSIFIYAKIQAERLLFLRLHQKQLRREQYIDLRDAIARDGNVSNIGPNIILPATYADSPRHMHEYAQDARIYVRMHGRPDLFITFTCNPNWVEISNLLTTAQKPIHRNDLIARVFKQNLMRLIIDLIVKKHIFGEVVCWMYTIEWQKRGLPHAHILIWLKNKIMPVQIDDIISAELPNPHEDPILFEIITRNNIHGPCGALNRSSPCMKDGKCTKRYPREFVQETQTGNDGYPLYRRRKPDDGGHTATIQMNGNNVEIDNRWVVPYSPLLSKIFNAHINVEFCSSIKSIKCLASILTRAVIWL